MPSPTGYVAVIDIHAWSKADGTHAHRLDVDARPVLRWDHRDRPVISDEQGNLTTPEEYVKAYVIADPDDEYRYTGSFEIHGE